MVHRNKAVSEIIGTMLVFAILISVLTAFELWYVPSTQTTYEEQFQVNSQESLSSLISDLENPNLQTGQIISQSLPMGIQGSFLTTSTQSSVEFQNSGYNATLSYRVGINYKLLENTVPTAITNKVVGTFPAINGKIPTQAAYDYLNGNVYVTDYGANAITEINLSTGKLLNQFYVGMNPYGIVFANGFLYISNFFSYYSANGPYSTITVFDPSNNSIVGTINAQGNNQNLLYPSGMVAVPSNRDSSVDSFLYVAALNYSYSYPNYEYVPQMLKINLTNWAAINVVVPSMPRNLNNSTGVSFPSPGDIINVSLDNGLYNYIWMTDYYQSAVTIFNISSQSASFIHEYINHPFSLAYDDIHGKVYITDSSSLLINHPYPHHGKGKHKGQLKKALHGNITVYNASLSTGSGFFMNLTIPVALPAAISIGPATDSNQNIYVGGYNQTYNSTGQFWYSSIVAINTTAVAKNSSNYINLSGSYNLNGSNGFIQGPVFMSYLQNLPNNGGLLIVDNASNNVLVITNLTGKLIASFIWDSPFNSPSTITYDSTQSLVVVGNSLSQNIALINPATQETLQESPYAGENLSSITYNPFDKLIYAANSGSNNVTVINPQTWKTVANIPIPSTSGAYSRPSFITYDPNNGSVYVLAGNTSTIYQIKNFNLTSNIVLPSVNGVSKTIPYAATFSNNGTMFIAEYNASNVAEVNLTLNKVVMNFNVGLNPDAITYDSLNNMIYVGDFASNNVSTIDLTTLKTGSFSVGNGANPTAVVLDPGNGYLYISNSGSNNITLNNTYTSYTYNSIATGMQPSGMAYDPDNGLIYITNYGSNQVTVINGGSTYFNSNPGKLIPITYYGSGQIVSVGPTAYVTPVTFNLQDNMLLSNYSASKYIIASANVPISLADNNGNVTFSAYILNLAGQSTSYSGIGVSTIVLNITKVVHNQYYIGKRFTYYDLYGNGYPAMVTGIYLASLNYTINSPYSQEINSMLFKQYNHSSSNAPFNWKFGNFPVFVKSTSSAIYLDINTVMKVYSINFVYTNAAVVGV
jgi:YVTN family beta-propeller protein